MSNTEHTNSETAEMERFIARTILQEAYAVIDEMLSAQGAPSKTLVVRARRLLPGKFVNSFEYTGDKT